MNKLEYKGTRKICYCKSGARKYYTQGRFIATDLFFAEIGVTPETPQVDVYVNKRNNSIILKARKG